MSKKLRLLVVEDNPADADFIHEMLPQAGLAGFEIESVARLSEALTRLESKDIDIVLLDLGLPDSQGLQTFHTLRKVAPDIPVIVLTGNDDQELAVAAVRHGAQDYLVKGRIDGDLLVRAARYALERERLISELREALANIKTLKGLLPICTGCKKSATIKAIGARWKAMWRGTPKPTSPTACAPIASRSGILARLKPASATHPRRRNKNGVKI